MVPTYYYDLLLEINKKNHNDIIYFIVGSDYPIWLTDQDFKNAWLSQGKSLCDYNLFQLDQDELIQEDTCVDDQPWNKFKLDYINFTKENLKRVYNLTLYKNGKWRHTVVSATIDMKSTKTMLDNMVQNTNNCTQDVLVKDIFMNRFKSTDLVNTIKLTVVIKDTCASELI
jgi:hypothetical protein